MIDLAQRSATAVEDGPRYIAPEDWSRFERYMSDIFGALGLDLRTPGTRTTPQRFLRALL